MRICLYVLGHAVPAIAEVHGQYDDWFASMPALADTGFDAVDCFVQPPPRADDYTAMILTGSPSSLTEPQPWMEQAADVVRRFAAAGTPVLGVCFGHQLIAHAFGGRVVRAAVGHQISSQPTTLTNAGAADPLFAGIPRTFAANLAHEDEVELPEDGSMTILAHGPHSINAIGVGNHIRGVQFHPEFTGEITRTYVDKRADELGDRYPVLRRQASDTPQAAAVVANFLSEIAARA